MAKVSTPRAPTGRGPSAPGKPPVDPRPSIETGLPVAAQPLDTPPVEAQRAIADKPAVAPVLAPDPAVPPALAAKPKRAPRQSASPQLFAPQPVARRAAPRPEPVAAAPVVKAATPKPAPVKQAAAPVPAPTPEPVSAPIPAPIPTIAIQAAPPVASPPAAKEIPMDTINPTSTMNTASAKAETMFADINARAKTAMEKSTKAFEDINEFSKGNIEAVVESAKIAAKGFESMGQDAAEYGRKSFESASAAMKSMSSVKSPAEFFRMQSDFVRGAFDAMVAESSRSTEAMLKLAGEVAQPLSNRAAIAAEKVKLSA